MKKYILFFFTLCLLPACFLTQAPPPAAVMAKTSPSEGVVVMKDVFGAVTGAAMGAGFYAMPEKARSATYALLEAEPLSLFPRLGSDRAPKCGLDYGKKKKRAAPPKYLSAGKVGIGPALQNYLEPLEEGADHRYGKALEPGFAGGLYRVKATGSADVPEFEGYLSVPERLETVSAKSGQTLTEEDGVVTISKKEGFEVAWKKPTFVNNNNIVKVELLGESETEWFYFSCLAAEMPSRPENPGLFRWNFPADNFEKLPTSVTQAELHLLRGHVNGIDKRPQFIVDFEGIREWVSRAKVVD